MLNFVILGRTALTADGRNVPIGPAKQRALLALLLFHLGEPVRVDTVVEHLWDGRVSDARRQSLYSMASRIRAVLNGVGVRDALARVNGSGGYRLDLDPELVDYHRFKRLVAEARMDAGRQRYAHAAESLAAAVELWQDEPLADLRGPRADDLRRSLRESQVQAHKALADAWLRTGRHEAVLAQLEPLLYTEDLDETLAQQWIQALCAAGRDDDARVFVKSFRRRYRRQLRVEPAVAVPAPATVPTADPGPVGGGSGPRQLPHDITDFTGHADLLTELDALATPGSQDRIVVLYGMPGVGKTTMAVHWAHRRSADFPDGQLYLNANAYGPVAPLQPADALDRLLRALGVPAQSVPAELEQRRDLFNRLLAGRRMVLLLDNVGDSAQVRPLLPTSGTCVTLITSRNRLRGLAILDGVRSHTLPPLPDRDGRDLLRRIVGPARANAEPEAVDELTRVAGGLPLALRIIGVDAAERPESRIAELVAELADQLLERADGDDAGAELGSVFAWSYRALSPAAARMFRILGLHPAATIGTGAAAALAGTDPQDADRLLGTLAKVHLINRDTGRRYRFHDLLQRYAADRAASEEPPEEQRAALGRLLDWYLLSATNAATRLAPHRPPVPDLPSGEGLYPAEFPSDAEAMAWCEGERANLVAVTRWAAEHGAHRRAWQIPGTIHEVFERYGRQDDVLELQKIAVAAARRDGHPEGQVGSQANLGGVYYAMHDYQRAADCFEEVLRLARGAGHRTVETVVWYNLAATRLLLGDTARAVDLFQELLDIHRQAGDPRGEAYTLQGLGRAHERMRDYTVALGYYTQALEIRERIGSLRGQGTTLNELAGLRLAMGQPELALAYVRRALEIHGRTHDEAARCDALITLAEIECRLGTFLDAAKDADEALGVSEDIADAQRRARALTVLAEARAGAGDAPAAQRLRREALSALSELTGADATALRQRLSR